MATREIDPKEWRTFFDSFTKGLGGKQVEIEVASLDLGDQILAEWLPLIGITYDFKNDLLEIALEGIDRLVRSPQEIQVSQDASGMTALYIRDAAGARQIVTFREPLGLPRL